MVVFFIFLFGGCGGSSDSISKVNAKDYSFIYSVDHQSIDGYFMIALDKIWPSSNNYSRSVKLTNFVAQINCDKKSQTFSPDSFTLSDASIDGQSVDVNVLLNGSCYENNFTIQADEIVTITYANNPEQPQVINKKWSHTFNIQNIKDPSLISEIVLEPLEFNVTEANQTQEINVTTLNFNKELLSKTLQLSIVYEGNVVNNFGDLNETNITTSLSTVNPASFLYTAPDSIDDINGTQAEINVRDPETNQMVQMKINFLKQ